MAFSDVKKFVPSWRGGLLLLGGLGVLVLVVLALWHVPQWQAEHVKEYPYQLAKLTDEYRRTLAQILGGMGLLYGLYLGWRRVRAAEEGQITERFTKAIAQLGDKEMAIRLGGIYALERIARDSEKDHGPIMDVLTAYVREKAPRKNDEYDPQADERPPTDIQAILTVLGRRETTGKNRGDDLLDLDLNHTRLVGANLTEADLSDAYLIGADLSDAALNDADLIGANLTDADLTDADLTGANLFGADLSDADLTGANLFDAVLTEAENLTAEQVLSAINWRKAYLPDYLQHLPHAHPAPPAGPA